MRLWFSRVLTALFVCSLLVGPQSAVWATEEPDSPVNELTVLSEPDVSPQDEILPTENGESESGIGDSGQPIPTDGGESEPGTGDTGETIPTDEGESGTGIGEPGDAPITESGDPETPTEESTEGAIPTATEENTPTAEPDPTMTEESVEQPTEEPTATEVTTPTTEPLPTATEVISDQPANEGDGASTETESVDSELTDDSSENATDESVADEEDANEDELVTTQSDAQPAALDPLKWGLLQPQMSPDGTEILIPFLFLPGFTAAADGRTDTFSVQYDASVLTLGAPGTTQLLLDENAGIPGSLVTVDPVGGVITVTFTEYFEVPGDSQILARAVFPATVALNECTISPEPYSPSTEIWFQASNTSVRGYLTVYGPECPPLIEPTIADAHYDDVTGTLAIIIINFSYEAVAGHELTLTYPTEQMTMDPGPFDVLGFSESQGREYVVGTATAANGLITIAFFDTGIEGAWSPIYISLPVGWLKSADCADTTGKEWVEVGDLTFVSNHGTEFNQSVSGLLCNAEPASKTGTWVTLENGDPAIQWSIDTGDVIDYTRIADEIYDSGFTFDCESVNVEFVAGENVRQSMFYCDDFWLEFMFEQFDGEPYRVVVTFTTPVDTEMPRASYVNCALVDASSPPIMTVAAAGGSNGLGGSVCAEVFPPEVVGDKITVLVDKDEARVGDTLHYTIEVTTAADSWSSITLSNPFPNDVDVDMDSITCAVVPAEFGGSPCYAVVDDELGVVIYPSALGVPGETGPIGPQNERYLSAPATITVAYSAVVTGEPGTVVINGATSLRRIWLEDSGLMLPVAVGTGDPSIIGGGHLYAEVHTLILPDPVIPPVDPPVDPGEPPVDPGDPPVDPGDPPVDPVDPPIDPVDPPVDPVNPVEPGTPIASETPIATETPIASETPVATETPVEPTATPGIQTPEVGATPDPVATSEGGTQTPPAEGVTVLPETGSGSHAESGMFMISFMASICLLASVLIGKRVRSGRA